jgi:hypothetical protein
MALTPWYFLAAVLVFAIVCNIYDATMTEKGLAAHVAIEGNSWLVGTTPKAWQLYARDIPIIFVAAAPSFVGYFTHQSVLYYMGLVGPIVVGIKHIIGGREWAALLKK